MEDNLLTIHNLRTSFRINGRFHRAVDGISLTIHRNEVLAIVGESGCGKSALALSIMGLHPPDQSAVEGSIDFQGRNLLQLSTSELNQIRGKKLAMIFQDPMTALHPLWKVGRQIEEPMKYHSMLSTKQRRQRTLELLKLVGIQKYKQVYQQYPHELSGGMRQRILIAIALACDPVLLVADEPTTALDVTVQAQILELMKELQRQSQTGILLITHDLGVVAEMADRVAVMYAGEIVELAPAEELFRHPRHPYTQSLFHSLPSSNERKQKLHAIEGIVPAIENLERAGCRFAPRIPWIAEKGHDAEPVLQEIAPGHFVRCSCYQHFYLPDGKEEKDVSAAAT
ncbi:MULTISPECIES: ABC transporter ATP-binding protein [Sporosarcina]|uniref:ABC transporter ATP-binding protein n=1 Tax=Sporosarcina TaxID=1569 RepID=UPI00129B2072|nr:MULTISPECIES: ABC transporter ATP-binding protein [Sporosarcina]GKV63863.1 peptide ABC transporter ATP-binding protein [Sporosarcina sp. NCCP-2331]GLB54642.1 peptide ABC transporter ATP-binding protein [Sporosarcina sp. NCCP-2378]